MSQEFVLLFQGPQVVDSGSLDLMVVDGLFHAFHALSVALLEPPAVYLPDKIYVPVGWEVYETPLGSVNPDLVGAV